MRKAQEVVMNDQNTTTERKLISRMAAKDFLKVFKLRTLQILVDTGILRDLRNTDMEYLLVP